MTAFKVEGQDKPILSFTKVLDKIDLGMEEEENNIELPADRAYWVKKSSEENVSIVDDCGEILEAISTDLALKFNRTYIGIAESGISNNFISFWPSAKKPYVGLGASAA